MTVVKIKAYGHLGNFQKEYILEEGKEFDELIEIFRDLTTYARKGKQKIVLQVFRELARLEKEA